MAIGKFSQFDFSGGMNLLDPDYLLGDNQYGLAFNVRNRNIQLESIKDKLEDTDAPHGTKQGLFGIGDYLVLFVNGRGYYKNKVTDGAWTQIADLSLSISATRVYAEAVPASFFNYGRQLTEEEQINGSDSDENFTVTNTLTDGTPAGLVVQDGENTPWLILPDATARVLQTYNQWTKLSREYVPVMTLMKYSGGILYGIAPDGKTIYRSVTGRPLDFVVNVDQSGNKGGDAETTSYGIGVENITGLFGLTGGGVIITTKDRIYPITIHPTRRIFGEPTFENNKEINAGVVNQYSFLDILTDFLFIDEDGIRSYNNLSALNNEGRNSVFSKNIQLVLNSKQLGTEAASIFFDNYAIFSVKTNSYGNVLAVYDTIREIWVSLDTFGITVKQFAVASQGTNPTLYCITADKVYKLYSSESYLTSSVNLKTVISPEHLDIQIIDCDVVLSGSAEESTVRATLVENGTESAYLEETSSSDLVDAVRFDFINLAKQSWKSGVKLSWSDGSSVSLVKVTTQGSITNGGSIHQQNRKY